MQVFSLSPDSENIGLMAKRIKSWVSVAMLLPPFIASLTFLKITASTIVTPGRPSDKINPLAAKAPQHRFFARGVA